MLLENTINQTVQLFRYLPVYLFCLSSFVNLTVFSVFLWLSVPTLQPRSSGSRYTYLSTCLVLCALWEPPAQKMVMNKAIWRRSASSLRALAHLLSSCVPDEMSFSVFSPVRTWNGILLHHKIVPWLLAGWRIRKQVQECNGQDNKGKNGRGRRRWRLKTDRCGRMVAKNLRTRV